MTQRDYRSVANSSSGAIADSDTFTFDRSGRMLTAVSGRYNNMVGYAFDPVGHIAVLIDQDPIVRDGDPENILASICLRPL